MPVLRVKDYTVSGEIFDVWHCNACTARFTQNVPPSGDIGKYYKAEAYISHTGTKKGLVNRLYHIVRNRTLQTKRRLVEKTTGLTKGSLLDVGAGTGAFAAAMRQAGWAVTGLEPDDTARANARTQNNIELQSPDTLFNLPANSFDAITLWHVLEHVHNLHEDLHTFNTLLKPNGVLLIAVPNYTSYDAAIYSEHWAAYDVPRHIWHFTPADVKRFFENQGFKLESVLPMPWDAYYICMLSEKYKARPNDSSGRAGNVNYGRAMVHGWTSNNNAKDTGNTWSSQIYILKPVK